MKKKKQFGGNIINNGMYVNPYTYNLPGFVAQLDGIQQSKMGNVGKGWMGANAALQWFGQSKLEKEAQENAMEISLRNLNDNYAPNMYENYYRQGLSLMQLGGPAASEEEMEVEETSQPSIFELASIPDYFSDLSTYDPNSTLEDDYMTSMDESEDDINNDIETGVSRETPTESAKDIMSYIMDKHGLPKHVAAGITANMRFESNFNPTARGDNNTSFGSFQWRDPVKNKGRKTDLINWMRSNGKDINNVYDQIDFAIYEAAQRGDLEKVTNTNNAAAAAFNWAKYFERPKDMNRARSERSPYANKLMEMKKGGPILDPMGQWAHPGAQTIIPSGDITMQGVPYPVLGIDNLGNSEMMFPGIDYNFEGDQVLEIPMTDNWLKNY